MRDKKSDNANVERKKQAFFYTGLVVALAISLIAFEWTSSAKPTDTGDIVLMSKGGDRLNVIVIDENNIPERPKPTLINPPAPTPTTDSLRRKNKFQFTAERESERCTFPEGEFVKPEDNLPCIDPYRGSSTRSVFDIDQRPHYTSCLVNSTYTPMSFDCTKEKVFGHVRENLHVPVCVARSGGKQTVLALVELDATGTVSKVRVLNSDDVCADCIVEARRVLQSLPAMNPGIYGGQPVRISFSIPIKFEAI